MSIKRFRTFVAEADAKDYVAPKDSDKEATEYEPRSKGEKEFADKQKSKKKEKHPEANDNQFDGSRKAVKEESELDESKIDMDGVKIIIGATKNRNEGVKELMKAYKISSSEANKIMDKINDGMK